MLLPVKIEGKPYVVPTSWKDVSVKMFFELLKCTQGWANKGRYDLIELYSVLTGCPYEIMNRCKQGDVTTLIEKNTVFTQTMLDVEALELPSIVKIKGQYHIVPVDLELESFGQKMAVDSEIVRIDDQKEVGEIDKRMQQIVSVCSIYFYKQLTGNSEFDFDAAMKQAKWVENASIVEMYPVAVFFSQRSNASMKYRKKHSLIKRMMMRGWLGLKGLIGIHSKRSTASQVET
jgi:hypothetical protein